MKKIISILLITVLSVGVFSACGFELTKDNILDALGDQISEIGDFLNNFEEVDGAITTDASCITLKNDAIDFVLDTKAITDELKNASITADTLRSEMSKAETAGMKYELRYECLLTMDINGSRRTYASMMEVTPDTYGDNIRISVPLNAEVASTTIYDLLKGKTFSVQVCLAHGTDKTKAVSTTYCADNPTGATDRVVLKVVDNRTSESKPQNEQSETSAE